MGINYTILGLGLDILGAWLIAYDFFFGYHRKWKAKIAENRIDNLESIKTDIKKMWDLPTPPYTVQEVSDFKNEIDQDYNSQIEMEGKIIELNTSGHEDKAIWVSLVGLLLLTIGFVFQIVGAMKA